MKRRIESTVAPRDAGKTLLAMLAERFTYRSEDEWKERIRRGELSVNERSAAPETLLAAGDAVRYQPEDLVEPPVRSDFRIVRKEADFLVIDKPGNLPVHPAGPYFEHTLWGLLHEECPELHFVNRLDRETSGLLLAARSASGAAILSKQLPTMFKRYLVIVHGAFAGQVRAEGTLVRDEASAVRKKRRFLSGGETGERAVTELRELRQVRGFTLVEAVLHTGRFHQVRATLSSLGFPVVGDKLYGPDENLYRKLRGDRLDAEDRARLILDRQALHCAELGFRHPVSGEELRFASPLPPEMAALLE